MKNLAIFLMLTVTVMTLNIRQGYANGFKILGVKSAKATAMGEAFIAQADNPSAIAFNPAGLTQLKGTQISVEGLVTKSWIEHKGVTGEKEHSNNDWQLVPASFITTDLGTERIAIGIGVTAPYGLSSRWGEKGFARYEDTFSSLKVIDINPSMAVKIDDSLSVGAGLSYYYSDVMLDSMVDYGNLIGLPGQLDGKSELKGTGDGWGYNFGILCSPDDRQSFAVTFKSPFKINYGGSIRLTSIPAFMGLGHSFESDAVTSIKFPAVLVVGYACRPIDKLTLEFDLDWTRWQTLNDVTVDFSSSKVADATYKYNYVNTFSYKLGAEYGITENLQLRGGYIYNENATPENYWRPSLPDTNSHFICSGFGYSTGSLTIDGAVQLILYEDRAINNNVDKNEGDTSSSIDGKYENIAVGFSLGATYRF